MKAVQSLTSTHIDAFLSGSCDCAYEFFGAHPARREEQSGWLFRVWAPNARSVHVAGPFNGWTADNYPMHALSGGIWECFAPGLQTFDSYQYLIETQSGKRIRKSDPFAFHAETRPGVCSKLFDLSGYDWNDGPWLEFRSRRDVRRQALNIYELHLGSWRRTGDGRYLSYREIAKWLVPYVKEMGFTAVEFLPVMEHSADATWGYQCTGYFAPTSRFGTPHDFMYLVDQLHQAGVAVLLDWVPAHFPTDPHGLAQFDGTPCFESDDPKQADLPVWRTKCFDLGKGEVQSFLTSCALFWIRQYHIDGLRMDGASSVIYLGYDKGLWHPDWTDGERNLQAVVFLRHLNTAIHSQFPAVITAAEETTVWRSMT
ncbi:MAG: alpha-amylase family glycosyl hydrolase, partial [Candidatus Onthomonas sp.]|nr:alpha-amylase family glycosyl hydrolase [Candidatus Onthomonas sp.]